LYDLKIQRGKIIETKKALKVRCVKQEIEGVIIPQGFEVWLPNESIEGLVNGFSMTPIAQVWGWKLNQVLKFLFMEELRNG
jgi:hypothetical protein